jgi:hypothetical protein
MHKHYFTFLFFLLAMNSYAADQRKGGAELLNPSAYAVNSSILFFQTTGYYNNEGLISELLPGTSYNLTNVDLSLAYGISKNFQVSGFGRFRSVNSTLNDLSLQNSGPESLGGEAKYGFEPIGPTKYAMGVHYLQTFYTNPSFDTLVQLPTDQIVLGDSGSEYGVDLFITHKVGQLKFDGKSGYNSPANNLSDEVRYRLEGQYLFTQLALVAGLDGIYSLKKDPYGDANSLKPFQAVGSTRLFNSINREKVELFLGANYAFKKVLVGFQGASVIKGTSTDKGNSLMFSMGWSSEGVSPESIKVNSFKEYQIDGSVLKVSARGNFLRIDQGLSTDVEKGMKFDIYQTDYFGGNELVASGVVYQIGSDWSVVKITKKFLELEIKPGFSARGY